MGREFIPTHVLVSPKGHEYELVKEVGTGVYDDLDTWTFGGHCIFEAELKERGESVRKLTAEEHARYVKLAGEAVGLRCEVEDMKAQLEIATARLRKVRDQLTMPPSLLEES